MASTLTISPAIPITAITTISQFPENPRSLLLQQCKTTKDLTQIHAHLIKTRLVLNPAIAENLLESAAILLPNAMDYASSIFREMDEPDSSAYNIMIRGHIYKQSLIRLVEVGRLVFDGMSERGVVAWNSMIAGYTKSGCWEEVVKLFCRMRELGVGFDEVTLISVLTACGRLADLELGEWIREHIEANGLKKNLLLMTSLVDMYAKCGEVDTARRLFDQMDRRDVVAWSAMISGYSQANRCREALDLFHEMQKTNVEPNEVTMVSVLYACAVLGALETGKWVHFYIKKKKMKLTVTLGTALIDFYANTDSSLASNGQGKRALDFFYLMREKNIEPNDVTFLVALVACSHAGLVDEGRSLFVSMSKDFGMEPRIEHYGCSQNVEIGEESFRCITRLEPAHSGDYILLSNIYASVGRREDALRVRCQMLEKGIKKPPGGSLIELDGVVHEFFSEDDGHAHLKEIYSAIADMIKQIKSAGYVPNPADARLDAEEDDTEASVSHHSEKLAIAFGLIRTPPGTTIRISKNLRVCTDCHNATKVISKVYNREIVVRDRNRFHHFKEGSCSCNDYW
ncbi:hypothetical protein SLA2020_270370 [Shorea laevis]